MKVTDRRQFTAEGVLRDDAPAATPQGETPPSGAHAPAASVGTETPVTFSAFVVSLATQAAELIGGESKDLEGARQIISVLEMLKSKSEGNRSDEETRLLDAVLFDLRMAFVGFVTGGMRAGGERS